MTDTKEIPSRLPRWVLLATSSAITLGALDNALKGIEIDGRDKWALACSAITMTIGAIASFMYLVPKLTHFIDGTPLEGVSILIVLACWCGGLPITSSENLYVQLKSTKQFGQYLIAVNANVYYFSWGAFIASLLLASSYLQSVLNLDVIETLDKTSTRFVRWFSLLAFGFIIMVSSVDFYRDLPQSCPGDTESKYCNHTLLGIALGCFTIFMSMVIVILKLTKVKHDNIKVVETIFAACVAIVFAVCVGFITVPPSPGSQIGNLYYFTWFSFLTSVMLSFDCVCDLMKNKEEEETPEKVDDRVRVIEKEHPAEKDLEVKAVYDEEEIMEVKIWKKKTIS